MAMVVALAFAGIVIAVVGAALVCHLRFSSRVRRGAVSRGDASAVTLITLLTVPAVAAVGASAAVAALSDAAFSAMLFFYGGYAVGLVCFIVLNRRFRNLAEQR
jgi:hypothetical protein